MTQQLSQVNILAFAGSVRKESWNRKVLGLAVQGARDAGANVTLVDLADYPMPIYDADWHKLNGVPESMLRLREKMRQANGLLIASPEYNSSITPLLKNTIDWLSQPVDGVSGNAPFTDKIGAVIGASDGGFGTIRALPHVSYILSNLGVFMLPVVAVPGVSKLFDTEGRMTNERSRNTVMGLGAKLARMIEKLG